MRLPFPLQAALLPALATALIGLRASCSPPEPAPAQAPRSTAAPPHAPTGPPGPSRELATKDCPIPDRPVLQPIPDIDPLPGSTPPWYGAATSFPSSPPPLR